jgi:maleylpyruvate isomerase
MRLHTYFRSGAAWRVRIALGLKGVQAEPIFQHLRRGEQLAPGYLRVNPQGLVPTLVIDSGGESDSEGVITQSIAIIEWLEEAFPEPKLLPGSLLERAHIRAFALAIACDIHPLHNLRTLARVGELGGEAAAADWARGTVESGLSACQDLLRDQTGPFCFGSAPTLADVCLVPALGSARRFGAKLDGLERLLAAEAACAVLPAFVAAAPGAQPDAE